MKAAQMKYNPDCHMSVDMQGKLKPHIRNNEAFAKHFSRQLQAVKKLAMRQSATRAIRRGK